MRSEQAVERDLIFDVGLHNGGDTGYYLHQGYRVAAFEAHPELVDQAKARFSNAIAAGRLTILNVGIAESSGTADFWVCDAKHDWNSFDRRIASRHGGAHHALTVPTRSFAGILAEYGIPYYLKIDIEGCDHLCVRALSGAIPPFISVETECLGDDEPFLTEANSVNTLDLLREKGYTRFKLIFQRDFSSVGLMNFRLPPGHYPFRTGDSGPWGDQTAGEWLSYDGAREALAAVVRTRVESWHDWHAAV